MTELVTETSGSPAGAPTLVASPEPPALPALPSASIGDLIPDGRFTDRERAQIETIAKGIDFTSAESIISQMNAPNQKFADAMTRQLADIRVYETGEAAGIILELSRQIKATNLARMKRETTGEDWVAANFGKMPVVGPYVSAIRHFQLNHKKVVDELTRIRQLAQKEIARLRAAHHQLELQEHATEAVLREMMVHIAACQRAVTSARAAFDAERAAALTGDRDPFKIQKLREVAENITMLETRLINAKASFLEKMLSIPDIRAHQAAARIEMANTMDTIQNDLPDLASAIGRLVAAYNISRAQEGAELRRKNREALATASADALDRIYTAAKASQAGAAEQIEQLSQRVTRLMATLDRGAEIDAENTRSRAESEARLVEIRDTILAGLSNNAELALRAA